MDVSFSCLGVAATVFVLILEAVITIDAFLRLIKVVAVDVAVTTNGVVTVVVVMLYVALIAAAVMV